MKRALIGAGLAICLSGVFAAPAMATSTGSPGQPNQSCQSVFGPNGPFTPSGFNTAGFNHATTVYAGAQTRNSSNPKSVAQYDVACFQAGSH
jgi:hypothetical protein